MYPLEPGTALAKYWNYATNDDSDTLAVWSTPPNQILHTCICYYQERHLRLQSDIEVAAANAILSKLISRTNAMGLVLSNTVLERQQCLRWWLKGSTSLQILKVQSNPRINFNSHVHSQSKGILSDSIHAGSTRSPCRLGYLRSEAFLCESQPSP